MAGRKVAAKMGCSRMRAGFLIRVYLRNVFERQADVLGRHASRMRMGRIAVASLFLLLYCQFLGCSSAYDPFDVSYHVRAPEGTVAFDRSGGEIPWVWKGGERFIRLTSDDSNYVVFQCKDMQKLVLMAWSLDSEWNESDVSYPSTSANSPGGFLSAYTNADITFDSSKNSVADRNQLFTPLAEQESHLSPLWRYIDTDRMVYRHNANGYEYTALCFSSYRSSNSPDVPPFQALCGYGARLSDLVHFRFEIGLPSVLAFEIQSRGQWSPVDGALLASYRVTPPVYVVGGVGVYALGHSSATMPQFTVGVGYGDTRPLFFELRGSLGLGSFPSGSMTLRNPVSAMLMVGLKTGLW